METKIVARNTYQLGTKRVNAVEVESVLSSLPELNAEAVLEVAKDPESLIHRYFEWDDSVAAHNYRLIQARVLIVCIKRDTGEGQLQRAFENVVIDNKNTFVPTADVLLSEDLTNQVLEKVLREALYWREKHERYKKFFGGIFSAIDATEEEYRRKSEEKQRKAQERRVQLKTCSTAHKKVKGKTNNSGGHAVNS